MDILVKVPSNRKCAGSVDNKGDCWMLSFGDLDTPKTDVEVECTTVQLLEIRQAIDEAILQRIRVIETAPEKASTPTHRGSC
jgi:hypothetical protein